MAIGDQKRTGPPVSEERGVEAVGEPITGLKEKSYKPPRVHIYNPQYTLNTR